jgi:molybdopterin/thiamine biosynthesis adenylyltransferase
MGQDDYYWKMVQRNIGIFGRENQEKLRNTTIPVFGVGGGGGVVAEILTRSGVGGLRIVDIDTFEPSNINRQMYSFNSTLGERKVDVVARFLKDINPELQIEKFHVTDDETIEKMLRDVPVAMMCIDKLIPSIHVARGCIKRDIPMVETVVIPFLNVRVYNRDTVSFEQFHGFPTEDKTMEELCNLTESEQLELTDCFINAFAGIEGIRDYYCPEIAENTKAGRFPTIAPLVFLQGAMAALEAIKVILNLGKISYPPEYALYDPFQHKMMEPGNSSLNESSN